MSKRNKIIYWIATLWASLGMFSTAIVQIFNIQSKEQFITHLGYPTYFLVIIGIWKILGIVALIIPKNPLLKEWAYAGFFFVMSGAIISHLVMHDAFKDMFPALFSFILLFVSWYFRPDDRRVILATS